MMTRIAFVLFAAAIAVSAAAPARANVSLEFTSSDIFGSATPAGPGPYFRATFANQGDDVLLTMENLLSASTEFVTGFAFNFTGSGTLSAGNFTGTPGDTTAANTSFGTGSGPGIGTGQGTFTHHFRFPTSNAGAGIRRFKGGEIFTALLSSTSGAIDSSLFGLVNGTDDYAAIHVQGIGSGSTKIWGSPTTAAVPEPSPILLSLVAAVPVGVVGYIRRRRRSGPIAS